MKYRFSLLAVVIALIIAVNALYADVGVVAKVGTMGPGADLTVGVSEKLNVRVGGNALSLDLDIADDDDEESSASAEEIDLELNLQSFSALIDWHPFESSFRLSAGVILNNNEIDLTADPSGSVEINDKDYSVASLEGTVGFNSLAPYVGLGFGNAVDKDGRWTFAFDLGVMFQGAPDVELSATANDPAIQSQLDSDIAKEIEELEDDTDVISVYPVVSIGIGYRF